MLPSEEEVLQYFQTLSNWGRWGSDDRLGTLNFISAAKRIEATQLVRLGRMVSCARVIDTEGRGDDLNGLAPQRHMIMTAESTSYPKPTGDDKAVAVAGTAIEFLGFIFHGYRITHLDALSHVFWGGKMYNDQPAELVSTADGATRHDITDVRDGILTRGILIDVPRHRNVPWLEPGEAVTGDEVREILDKAAIELREGDALLLRTGYVKLCNDKGYVDQRGKARRSGWHASCLPLFHAAGISLIASDTPQDVRPSGYSKIPSPIHLVGIVAMGLWLLDNCDLERLADCCDELGVAEFDLTLSALPFVGATGSAVNPIGIF